MTNLSSSFWNEEICESTSEKTECSKEDVGSPLDGGEHIRSDETDDTIEC